MNETVICVSVILLFCATGYLMLIRQEIAAIRKGLFLDKSRANKANSGND